MDVTQTDENIVKCVLEGEREAYRTLVDRYSPMVFHVVYSFERDPDEADELSQQIFVKAYEKLELFEYRSRFSSWLYSLAMNHCRDYTRSTHYRNRRFSDLSPEAEEKLLGESEETPYSELETREQIELLNGALGKLKSEYAEPFLLKYRDGMRYEAISERLGVGVGALKVRVHRAKKELKEIIQNRSPS
ncbi:MAG: RNA polymerase sigma factor [Balneolaceae bacterium]